MSDPATAEWREAMGASTSARLRQTQHDLAASQADLTRVTAERDQFCSNYLRDAARVDQLDSDLVDMELDRDEARAEAKEWRAQAALYLAQRDNALHDLARAHYELTTTKARLDSLREERAVDQHRTEEPPGDRRLP
jgi:uncharacterized coiled-coil DUF342 family protein